MTVLVVGATGRTASHLVTCLLRDGVPVRALVRDRDKAETVFRATRRLATGHLEIVSGPFDDPALLLSATKGVDAAFLALSTSPQQIALERNIVDAAARAELPHLVRLSVFDADLDAGYEIGRRHGELDAYLAASGVPHTLLRPTYFSSNLLVAAPSIAATSRWAGLVPDGRVALIDTRDVAEAAAVVLRDPAGRRATYQLTGPEALTFTEIAERLSRVLGRRISYDATNEAHVRAAMAARGVPGWLADISVGIDLAMQASRHFQVTDEIRALTGAAPRPLEVFIEPNRAIYTPAG
ncbi:NmrA family NAD(P)-binding protein [Parafrankia sp. FMc6]|uniref:NmrA family NAD(P)-binding protein n=1 Tax=Parafrankia soli TaxID=2599596 RepID=UPI0034D4AB1F